MDSKEVFIVIPAKDEATRIAKVIKKVNQEGFQNIVVVDDGSSDTTAIIAKNHGATVLSHSVNLGPGAATQTGIEYAIQNGAQVIVTIDGDDQHYPSDIWRLVNAMEKENVMVVLGSRFLEKNKSIPVHRMAFNKIGNWVTALFTGLLVTDSQSGLKALHIDFARKIDLKLSGFEFCTEIINHIRYNKVSFVEIPINVKYTQDTMKKGQSLGNGFRMIGNFVRYFL